MTVLKAEELDCILYQSESSTRLSGSTALVLVKDLTSQTKQLSRQKYEANRVKQLSK